MPTIRRLAYSAVSSARPAPPRRVGGRVDHAERRARRTAIRVEGGCDAVQSRTPTPNAPIWSSWARSGLSAPVVRTRKSRPPSALRSMMTAPGEHAVPDVLGAAAAASVRGSKSNRWAPVSSGGQLGVEEAVHHADGLQRERRVLGDDADPGHRRAIEEPDAERDQGDDDGEADEQQRREHERPRPHALDVLAAGDQHDVGRVAAAPAARSGRSAPSGCGSSVMPRPRWGRRGAVEALRRPRRLRHRRRAIGRGEVRLLVGRVADEVDEHLLEARVRDLEVEDPGPGVDRRGEDGVGLDARSRARSTMRSMPDLDHPRAGDVGQPRQAVVAGDRDPDHPPSGSPAARRAAARRRPPGRGRRSRPTRTAPPRPPSGGSRTRRSGRGRGARGTPRAGASR